MKRRLLPATALAALSVLILFAPTIAFSQVPTATVSITAASPSGSNTTYTYTLTSGPALQVSTSIVITGMGDGGNNGTFTITALGSGTFTVVNSAGILASSQTGTGTAAFPRGTLNISAASRSGSNTTYSYSLTNGPDLQVGENIVITGMVDAANNGTFAVTAVVLGTSFTVVNASGVNASSQTGTGTVAFPQQLDALLEINGMVGAAAVKASVYDSQIHSGSARAVPLANTSNGGNCNSADATFSTDAYVLQGGSVTGCDPGDAFETSQSSGSNPLSGTGYKFAVTTFYTSSAQCNTNATICVPTNGPDTGFLTVTNMSDAFTGSITLTGTSPLQGGLYCPPIGLASDSFFGTLAGGESLTFALSPDSSNCGGFTPPLTQTLAAGDGVKSYTYPVGDSTVDTYVFTPINNVGDETLTITPVLIPRNATPPPVFDPGSMFSTFSCVPYADFSTALNKDECVEFHATCVGNDCATFFYQVQLHYDLAASLPAGVGGIGLLKADGGCPTNTFNVNILTSYAAGVDPIITGGDIKKSCFVSTFNPNATGGAVTDYQTFVGFQSPVSNTKTNFINAGKSVPLIWQQFQIDPNTGGVVPNNTMTLCTTYPTPCPGNTVAVQTYPVACQGLTAKVLTNKFPGSSSLQFFGNGIYDFNLKTASGDKGCFKVALIYGSTGVQFPPALFQFK